MKTKFSISLWTWVFLATAVSAGLVKEASLAMIALIGHELAHVFVTLSYGRKIASLTIYPFGGVVRGTDPLALFSDEEICIAFAGPAWNLFCTALAWLIVSKTPFWQAEITLWWQINLWMGLINLLPLFPLDGGRIFGAVLFKFLGYRKGIAVVSYTTQIACIIGVVYWFLFRCSISEVHYLLLATVLFSSAMKERQAAPFILLRYLLKKNKQLNIKKVLHAKIFAAQEETCVGDIVPEMKDDCYYIICGINRQGKKRFVGEKAVIDALIENGAKTRLQDVTEKDFII